MRAPCKLDADGYCYRHRNPRTCDANANAAADAYRDEHGCSHPKYHAYGLCFCYTDARSLANSRNLLAAFD